MSRRAQIQQISKDAAEEELPELEKEKVALEKAWDAALEEAENTQSDAVAAQQNLIADAIESDLNDLEMEIRQTREDAGIVDQSNEQKDNKQKDNEQKDKKDDGQLN